MICIRKETLQGIAILDRLFPMPEKDYFRRSLIEREVFVAEVEGAVAGYAQLNWNPIYGGFRARNIPEIQDINVLPDFRRRGIASALIAHCEALARAEGKDEIGISVGLSSSYGAAQRLYVKKSYIPDGFGVAYDDVPVRFGELRPVDDLLTLKLIKHLRE